MEVKKFPFLIRLYSFEFENQANEIWTVERWAAGERHKNLVTVHFGPLLTAAGQYRREDMFVRQPGAARSEVGFHRRLVDFLGWQLPLVESYDEQETPLYFEAVLPLMFIEQKRGWSDLQARFPTQFRIKDVAQRATEFLLACEPTRSRGSASGWANGSSRCEQNGPGKQTKFCRCQASSMPDSRACRRSQCPDGPRQLRRKYWYFVVKNGSTYMKRSTRIGRIS